MKNIFLVGPMGVGKTTIGKALARALKLRFLDSDHEIERRAGADIAWIFDVEGEAGFRERETQVLDDLTALPGVLISTGGGAVLRDVNRQMLKERGTVIFLDTSIDLQLKRTASDKKRPLLQTGDRETTLRNMKQQRQPLYLDVADVHFFVGEGGSRKLVNALVEHLREAGFVPEEK
ncbi:MAG: shikimate kinase AroK [Pseudomonadota bacterium]